MIVTKQKMLENSTFLRWDSSESQLADGVTKIGARQLLADRLRTHQISLQSDKSFQAAKKKTQAELYASARRNAMSRLVHKQSLAFVILTAQMTPITGLGRDEVDRTPDVLLGTLIDCLVEHAWMVAGSLHFELVASPCFWSVDSQRSRHRCCSPDRKRCPKLKLFHTDRRG